MLTMTATVKAMHNQRWVCRNHLFLFNGTSSEDEPAPAIYGPCAEDARFV